MPQGPFGSPRRRRLVLEAAPALGGAAVALVAQDRYAVATARLGALHLEHHHLAQALALAANGPAVRTATALR